MTIPPPTEKQAKILWASFTALAIGILITLTAMLMIGVGWIANALSSVLIPLAIAGIIAYILDPVVDWCHKKRRMKRHNAIILVFIIALLLVISTSVFLAFIFGKKKPLYFLKSIAPAQLLAFSTSSSAATLPVTMDCVKNKVGVDKDVTSFVLPLGATINIDAKS